MKQLPYNGLTNITCHRTDFISQGVLNPGIYALLLKSLKLSVLHQIIPGEKVSKGETDTTYCRLGQGRGEKRIFSVTT